MRVVGLTTYRNARQTVAATLSNLSEFCDVICAIDDRSTDGSVFEVRRWPKLGALIMLDADISTKPWHFSEDILYEALYRMAEPFHPDWVIQLDADETLEPANSVRPLLQCVPCEVRSFVVRRVSIWTDTRYPDMVPLLGTGTSVTRCVWRFAPGLKPQLKRLHNSRSPYFDDPPGKYLCASSIVVKHSGWNTLRRRFDAATLYTSLDPSGSLNGGVRYDEGLLFGYRRDQIRKLLSHYKAMSRVLRGPLPRRDKNHL